jgi:Ca2+-binding EF-hand superfamily protein
VVFVADDVIEVMSRWLKSTGLSVVDLFAKFDENDDGEITSEEFKNGLLGLNLADLPPSQIERLVEAIDEDGNGVIDLEELSNTFDVNYEPTKDIPAADEEDDSDVEVEDESDDDQSSSGDVEEEVDSEEPEVVDSEEAEVVDSEEAEVVESEEAEVMESEEPEEKDADSEDIESGKDADEESGNDADEEFDPEVAFTKLAEGIVSSGMTIKEAFESFDVNDDGLIDGPELQKGLEEIGD